MVVAFDDSLVLDSIGGSGTDTITEEEEKKLAEEVAQKAKDEAEKRLMEEAAQKTREQAEGKIAEEAVQKAKDEAERKLVADNVVFGIGGEFLYRTGMVRRVIIRDDRGHRLAHASGWRLAYRDPDSGCPSNQ
eukprot:11090049-Lingulodinium_polyedra.AAC.1